MNGAAGVLASGAAVLVSIETSLNDALWVGAIGYAAIAGIALRLLRLGDAHAARTGGLSNELVLAAEGT